LLAAQARATPKATALSFEDGTTLSYEELDTRARQIAVVLQTLGVGQDKLVGVRLPRCLGAVVGMVGILKADGAYVAIDTCFPPDRQAHILLESGLLVLLVPRGTAARAREEAGPRVAVVELGPLGEVWEVWPQESQGADASFFLRTLMEKNKKKEGEDVDVDKSRSLAYVLYTSGSTGKPKGVMVEHRGVVSLLAYFKKQLRMGPGDTVLGLTTFCFDISVLEIFGEYRKTKNRDG
jgi:acyl-CoA synthetase (AMP-forming)/AMP-acid ligase II